MADWQMRLEFKSIWSAWDSGEITVQQVCSLIAKEIRAKLSQAYEIDDKLADELRFEHLEVFEELAENSIVSVETFDAAMNDLYDWADSPLNSRPIGGRKMCWISTF